MTSEALTTTGGGGATISMLTAGPADGPLIVALHGIGQSRLAYEPLLNAADDRGWRVVAVDLRGHGDSDKPHDAYGDSQLWADDVAAVLESAGASVQRKATVVAWSYGGAVITDYLTAYGSDLIHAVVSLGATDKLGGPVGEFVQPAFGALGKGIMTDDTGAVAEQLMDLCVATPLDSGFRQTLLDEGQKCPAYVRNGMFRRTVDNDDAVRAFPGTWLAIQGTEDQMFTGALAQHLADTAPQGRLKTYQGVGHMPLWEKTDEVLDDIASVLPSD